VDWKREGKVLAAMLAVFFVAYFLPLANPKIKDAILEAFKLLQWYARNHTLACVVPAIFIAGAITTFLSQASVMKHLGPNSPKRVAYPVAAVSGGILAVCSCSVLPMFAGIYRLGAGLGPATAFLYAGPAINVLAIFLTARVLGFEIGVARAIGAVLFAILIGLAMASLFRREEKAKAAAAVQLPEPPGPTRPLWKTGLFLTALIAFLVFSDWYNPGDAVAHLNDGRDLPVVVLQETVDEYTVQVQESVGKIRAGDHLTLAKSEVREIETVDSWVMRIWHVRWWLAGLMGLAVLAMAFAWFPREELGEWMGNSWDFAKMLVPLLFGGVFVVGFIAALLPDEQVASLVGDNSLSSNLVASVVGAVFYFATLTEIPIVQALSERGMAEGPSLALLLAGPALSLPNVLVIGKVMGAKKTAAFCGLVVVMATATGLIYGAIVG
jgi:uncharacterized membrane protein YraQ (UPF0718 family)